jgi:hypothetical protein
VSQHLVLHGVVVKKHADARTLVEFTGLPDATVAKLLAEGVKSGRIVEAQGKYLLAALAKVALDGQYGSIYASLRASPSFMSAYAAFERINVQLKALITDWQTLEFGGARVANDHSDRDYDMQVIDRLGELHERAEGVLAQLTREVPRFAYYTRNLAAALERAEAGAVEWVSDARLPSYHTLWFELHEDLLRLVGRQRQEQ